VNKCRTGSKTFKSFVDICDPTNSDPVSSSNTLKKEGAIMPGRKSSSNYPRYGK
jgi:hypothetical protein